MSAEFDYYIELLESDPEFETWMDTKNLNTELQKLADQVKKISESARNQSKEVSNG